MSAFDRINAIENKIASLEGRLAGGQSTAGGSKQSKANANQAASFETIINSLATEQKFKPGQTRSVSAGQRMNSASVQPFIQEAAVKYDVDPDLIEAVIKQESAYNAGARSHVGAEGLMQLMPATAKELGVENSLDPRQNVMGGTKYLRQLLDQFDGNLTKVIAGYNAGPGAVSRYGGVPPYTETQDYVAKVLKNYEDFKS